MKPRLNIYDSPTAGKAIKHVVAAGRALAESTVPLDTSHLVLLRASQINGCAGCVDMHTKDALAAGESQVRLHMVATWREATVFTDAERAALELAEEGTRMADAASGVSDAVWQNAAKHYDEDQLGTLVCQIALINAFNRMNTITQQPAGDYEPGQYAHQG